MSGPTFAVERRRQLGHGRCGAYRAAALGDFATLAAARGELVLVRSDLVLAAERGFDGDALIGRAHGAEADQRVVSLELEQQHALAGARQVADLVHLAEQ